ncbi:MAG: hypothetical protein ACXV8U_20020 [Methylobacter sp.]
MPSDIYRVTFKQSGIAPPPIVNNRSQALDGLPSTEQLLVDGGDARLALDPFSGRNKYGCQPFPDPQLLSFSSSTASVISTEGFDVANRLRQKLLTAIGTESHATVYAREIQRIRLEWLQLCGLSDLPGLKLIISSSGTDTHGIAAQYAASGASVPPLLIMVEANETGSGVTSALNGNTVTDQYGVEVTQVSVRQDDGMPRPSAKIDTEVEDLVNDAIAADRRVLLILVDQSKTGLIAPSPACAIALHRRYPENVEVLVDACQFRIAAPTLRAYLEQGFMVALTGSKFLSGPSFSASLLLPSTVAKRLFPRGLLSSPPKADWIDEEQLGHATNFGLLLRYEVALEELRRFRAIPEPAVIDFLQTFAQAIQQRLTSDPHFEPLTVPQLERRPLTETNNWDHLQTIFPFLLYQPQSTGRIPLSCEQTLQVYQQLPVAVDYPNAVIASTHHGAAPASPKMPTLDPQPPACIQSSIRCQLGQPVACGTRNGIAVSALRLCVSSRLIVEATMHKSLGIAIISDALKTLDKTALLSSQTSGITDH